MTLRVSIAAAVLALALSPAATAGNRISVTVDRTHGATKLGQTFVFDSTITNHGPAPVSGLIAHLNVLSLRNGVYVDPEDWSSHRTHYLAPIPAGGSTTVTWPIKAVNAGSIGVYVAVLPSSGAPVAPITGPTVHISIAEHRTLNAGGILPLALAVPALIGLALLSVRIHRSRSRETTVVGPWRRERA